MKAKALLTALAVFCAASPLLAQYPEPQTAPRPPLEANADAGLDNFYKRLKALETGAHRAPLRILQIGDSHTVGDAFSGRLRDLFQGRFGDAGRGMLPPGKPWDYYRPGQARLTQSKNLQISSSFGKNASGLYGLTGFRTRLTKRGVDKIVLDVDGAHPNELVTVEFLLSPKGGSFTVTIDGRQSAKVFTKANQTQMSSIGLSMPLGEHRIQVEPSGDGPVDILSLATESSRPGVIYDSQGIVGATVEIINKWDQEIMGRELAARDPALILLVFGTNEGFDRQLDREAYEANFKKIAAFLKKSAPNADLLVVGPPDANKMNDGCYKRKKGRTKIPAEARDYDCVPADAVSGECVWYTPPNLGVVRAIQRAAAESDGYAFWDWSKVFGGDCGMHRWTLEEPPLASGDHVHLKNLGYEMSADSLFKAIIDGYEEYLSR